MKRGAFRSRALAVTLGLWPAALWAAPPADATPGDASPANASPAATTPPAEPTPPAASAPPAAATPPATEVAPASPTARFGEPGYRVLLRFRQERAGEPWLLVGKRGETLCKLPCERWVGTASGYQLALDDVDVDKAELIPVPDTIEFRSGRTIDATVVPRRPATAGWIGLVSASVGVIMGIVGGSQLGSCHSNVYGGDATGGPYPCGATAEQAYNSGKTPYRWIAGIGLGMVVVGGLTAWLAWGRPPHVEYVPAGETPR